MGTGDPSENNTISEALISSNQKGGFRVLPFIVVNMAFEKVASFGLTPNMILYLTREYRIEAAKGANIIFFWSAATNFTPILGAFIADSYVGRFRMIGFGSIASLLGIILLWLTAVIPQARPLPCDQFTSDSCQSPTTLQLLLLYSSFGLLSIGAGGIRSSSLAFGADQLGMGQSLKRAGILERFISWYYVLVSVSAVVAMTCIVYIQYAMGWKVGFGVPVVLMAIAVLSFFSASSFYVKSKPTASPFTGFAQVLAAAYHNRSIPFSSQDSNDGYHNRKGATVVAPSEMLRFLNKACIIENPEEDLTPDGRASNPWSLCTVNQVEELKALIKIIPIWLSGMIMSVNVAQSSFPVLQASTMDRHIISKFEIPAGSMNVFMVISLAIWVSLYDRVIVPLASKLRGKPVRLSLKQRMGIGILLSSASMLAFAIAEKNRRERAIREGFSDDPNAVVNMSVLWLLPYLVLCGLAETFSAIGQNEFYYTELPKSMSSIAATLFDMGLSAANLLASFIMSTIDSFSKRGGEESWVSSNINKGHYDYYYWLLASLSLLNFVYYLACSKGYGPCRAKEGNAPDDDGDY